MKEDRVLAEKATGFASLNTNSNPRKLEADELSSLVNMRYGTDGTIEKRKGSKIFKNNSQWGDVAVIEGIGYELGETGAEIAVLLADGRLFYAKVAGISAVPRSTFNPAFTWTEITQASAAPAIAVTDKNKVFIKCINNHVYICSGTNYITYFGSDHVLKSVPDPIDFEITMTVGAGVAATLDTTYTDADGREYAVSVTKVAAVGTSLILRQTGAVNLSTLPARKTGAFTLTKTGAGIGDASISVTAVTGYSDNYICLTQRQGRLEAITDAGSYFVSEPNIGFDFSSPQSDRYDLGKENGLTPTYAFPVFKSTYISLTNEELQQFSSASFQGTIVPDPNIIAQQETNDFFRVVRQSKRIAVLGRSGEEVDSGFVGLSRDGFIYTSFVSSDRELGLNVRDKIGSVISNYTQSINYSAMNNIRACMNEEDNTYICVAPLDNSVDNSIVFMYDVDKSTPAVANQKAIDKWATYVYNFGTASIVSMFTVFGVPHFGLSNGSIVQTEVDNVYTDIGNNYYSSFTTKALDFGIRSYFKTLKTFLVDLTLSATEQDPLKLNTIIKIDGKVILRDIKGKQYKTVDLASYPTEDVWTTAPSDVWTTDPFDVWGQGLVNSYSLVGGVSYPKFQEISITIDDTGSDKLWGAAGFEAIAERETEYADFRNIRTRPRD
jgi:hypothetical protein